MASLLADTASTSELALDAWVGAISLVVAHFTAVVAFAGHAAAAFALLRAIASEVAVLTTAVAWSANNETAQIGSRDLHSASAIVCVL